MAVCDQQIIAGGADYVLTPKGNQPTLQQGIKAFFDHFEDDFAQTKRWHETEEKGHGREEERYTNFNRKMLFATWLRYAKKN
jgi:hypothetical protein